MQSVTELRLFPDFLHIQCWWTSGLSSDFLETLSAPFLFSSEINPLVLGSLISVGLLYRMKEGIKCFAMNHLLPLLLSAKWASVCFCDLPHQTLSRQKCIQYRVDGILFPASPPPSLVLQKKDTWDPLFEGSWNSVGAQGMIALGVAGGGRYRLKVPINGKRNR